MMLQSAENTRGISYRINGDNKRYRVPTIERPMGNRLCCDTCISLDKAKPNFHMM